MELVVTSTDTAPAEEAGVEQVIAVEERTTAGTAVVAPNLQNVEEDDESGKLAPVMVTSVLPEKEPDAGESAEIVGGSW